MRILRPNPDAFLFSVSANQRECVMYDINCIASVRVATSCRETITGKAHTALRRM